MRPLLRILIVAGLTILLLQFSFIVFNEGLNKYNNHSTDRLTELFKSKTYYDILFIGTSRTHTSINPRIIDSICHVSSYNAGMERGNLLEFNMTYDAYLQNHPAPKILVLSVDLISFNVKKKFFNYTQYMPFLENRVIGKTLSENGYFTLPKKIFPFLWLTDYDDYSKGNALKGLQNSGETQIPKGEFQYKGYLSNSNISVTCVDTTKAFMKIKIDTEALTYLNAIINTCKKNNTHLILTYAPELDNRLQKHFVNSDKVFEILSSFAIKNNLSFLRHDRLNICHNPKLFANAGHLNTQGATVYSIIIAKELEKELVNHLHF